jgi:hypothetical protein
MIAVSICSPQQLHGPLSNFCVYFTRHPTTNVNLKLPVLSSALSLAGSASIVIDTTVPTIVHVTTQTLMGSYGVGQDIFLIVKFSDPVDVSVSLGTPSIVMETGTIDSSAIYTSGSGTDVLTFRYSVVTGDEAPLLDYKEGKGDHTFTTMIQLNGGFIYKAGTIKPAVLVLPRPGSTLSLAPQLIAVSTTSPAVTFSRVAPSTPDGQSPFNFIWLSCS